MFILVIKWLGVSILYLIFDEDLCNDKVFWILILIFYVS